MEPTTINKIGARQTGRTQFLVDAIIVQLTDPGNEPSTMVCYSHNVQAAEQLSERVLKQLEDYPKPDVFGYNRVKIAYGYNVISFRSCSEAATTHGMPVRYAFIDNIDLMPETFRTWVDHSLRPFTVVIQTSEGEPEIDWEVGL